MVKFHDTRQAYDPGPSDFPLSAPRDRWVFRYPGFAVGFLAASIIWGAVWYLW